MNYTAVIDSGIVPMFYLCFYYICHNADLLCIPGDNEGTLLEVTAEHLFPDRELTR